MDADESFLFLTAYTMAIISIPGSNFHALGLFHSTMRERTEH
jgi:hypothetical protein